MASSFGKLFCVTTFGESHGSGVGAVVDGCPGGVPFDLSIVQSFLDRRRPGKGPLVSSRNELDHVQVLSGIEDGLTLGSPICFYVPNTDQRKKDYDSTKQLFRPSHGDYTYFLKYGINSASGSGRSSARETIGRVAAGSMAQMLLHHFVGPQLRIHCWIDAIQEIKTQIDLSDSKVLENLQKNEQELACPDPKARKQMIQRILETKEKGDSVGGILACLIQGCPFALGEPVMDKLEADLAKAMMSLPATKGFDIGSGFSGASMLGSEHNDLFYTDKNDKIRTKTNYSGGIQGGISNGESIYFRVAFKPPSTVFKPQETIDHLKQATIYQPIGRHDPCVLPRAVPIVEAMTWIVLADHYLRQKAIKPKRLSKPR